MPTVTLNKKVFEKLVGKQLPLEQLKDKISFLGTDLEKIEGDEIIVEVFPNRPDMLSEQGFARAFSSFIGRKVGLRKYAIKKSNFKVIIDKSVNAVRPFTACAVVWLSCVVRVDIEHFLGENRHGEIVVSHQRFRNSIQFPGIVRISIDIEPPERFKPDDVLHEIIGR